MWLICAATQPELDTWHDALMPDAHPLVSGVGIPATLATLLPRLLAHRYSLVVNIGIAGAYIGGDLAIGDVVMASGDCYADLGMELPDAPGFLPLSETAFGDDYPERLDLCVPPLFPLPAGGLVFGATVNTCTGTDETGNRRFAQTGAHFETMEGAAVAHAGRIAGVPVCQIRAISNVAARRDMTPENIRLALSNLREYFALCARRNNRDAT